MATPPLAKICLAAILAGLTICVLAQNGEHRPAIQDPGGVVHLFASNAIVHGAELRYEPQTNKNCLGYWRNVEDWAEWPFEIKQTGEFTVVIWQGCGNGQGGSEVNVEAGGQTLHFIVKDTGGFQNWEAVQAGRIKLSAVGTNILAVKPQVKRGAAIMDIREVRLLPADPVKTANKP